MIKNLNYKILLEKRFQALSTGRVALENIIKYGILVDPMQMIKIFFSNTSIWPTIFTLFFTNTFIYYAFYIEKKLMKVFIHYYEIFKTDQKIQRITNNLQLISDRNQRSKSSKITNNQLFGHIISSYFDDICH